MDAAEEIKSRLSIEDVVSEYVQLKRAGRNWKGLSPFTSERTPSFMVSPEKGIWHDFSSGKGGNVFSFVMEMEGLDFKGALELLARKANVDLSQYQTGRNAEFGKLKERLYEAHEVAAKFYQAQLRGSREALTYLLTTRQFNKETVLMFRLGYAPNNGSALIEYMKKKGFTEQELQKAGLTARHYRGGIQDMFRGRIMVPLQDAQGRVIGFTARILTDDPNAPKYLNTPQTVLYDKGRHIFGLHLAKEAIRRSGYGVLVEGNFDVIASHQAGVANVVATAGTALTEMHLKGISRFAGDIRLAFDQDAAGIAATERAIPIAGKVGVSLSIITVPEGKDPDELVRKNPKAWQQAIDKKAYALDWLLQKYEAQLDITTALGKRQFSDVLLRVVRKLPDEVEQDHYIAEISQRIGVSKDALASKLQGIEQAGDAPLRKPKVQQTDAHQFDATKIQDHLLCLALLLQSFRSHLRGLDEAMFDGDQRKGMLRFLIDHPDYVGGQQAPPEELRPLADYVKILGLQYDELYRDRDEMDLANEASYLRFELIRQYVKTKKEAVRAQLAGADGPTTAALLKEVTALDSLLKQ